MAYRINRVDMKNYGMNFSAFANSRIIVSDVIDGKVDYDETSGKWYYKNKKNQKFAIGANSEGVKKIAIMERLLANGCDLHDGMPQNSIIDTSVELYEQEIEEVL